MKSVFIVVVCYAYMKFVRGSEEFDSATQEIRNDVEMVRAGAAVAVKEAEDAVAEYRRKKENDVGSNHSNDYNILQMYEWYEKEGSKATKKCLSSQRNLQMIRAGYKENVEQCFKRVDAIAVQIEDKVKSLSKMTDKYATTGDLTAPCEQLNHQEECLSQAKGQAKLRTESMMAIIQRFEIYKRLKMYEIDTHYDVCQSICQTYKESEKNEIEILQKCMAGDEDLQENEN